jgi:hypothetical protein
MAEARFPALDPPIAQALARLRGAREMLRLVVAPNAGSLLRRMEWTSRADREIEAAEHILRDAKPFPSI